MSAFTRVLLLLALCRGAQAAYPTACAAYSTCQGLQGDCCPNNEGVNLACCFSGALVQIAEDAKKQAKDVNDEAEKETQRAKAAATAAAQEAKKAEGDEEEAANKAKQIQAKIEDLNAHATAAQKKSNEAAAEATNDANEAAKQALAAEAAAKHAKKVSAEQQKIVAETSKTAAEKTSASTAARAEADKLNSIAGAATKKLNDAKQDAEKEAAAAKLRKDEEDKIVAEKKALSAHIRAEARKTTAEATEKEAAAESMLKKIDNAQCSKHAGCAGLSGYCCPTLDTNKMELGSTKLNGENLGCCGSIAELAAETTAPAIPSFHTVSMLLGALAGSSLTAITFKFFHGKETTNIPYERMAA